MDAPQALATYHLMRRLNTDHPTTKFSFVIGADLINHLKSWDAPGVPDAGERLWNECAFLVAARPGFELPPELPPNFELIAPSGAHGVTALATEEISSSEVRRRLERGGVNYVDGLLAPAVLAHIVRYGLYGVNLVC